ncbi:hypothetical protein GA0070558_10138 [Micromonospora haikouensis]|uniref:DinB-like domain-containing protein n=1 Tax=Micromonospora haikouensis TaxID=686309 RepID=A0A1C4TVV6_9ACTN|nr:hypothetical protein [Micromonospora haikouensis]SCE63571.1 hypothetical protein GA0070558_10138 [Micromonospora haikouensis]
MDSEALRRAYDEVLAEVAAGGFEPPSDGELSAEQIVAHLVANDELMSEATEAVLAGSPFAYYDLDAIHRPQLDALVAEYADPGAGGGWPAAGGSAALSGSAALGGLADRLRETSRRLCALVDRLGPAAQTPVETRLHEDVDLRVDETLPWARTLDLHARVHLPKHLAQLRALRPQLHAHRA